MLLVWTSLMVQLVQIYALQSNSCGFNSMCTCSPDQHDLNSGSIHTISCLSVPFYKFPSEYECQSYVRHCLTDLSFDVLLSNAISTEWRSWRRIQLTKLGVQGRGRAATRAFSRGEGVPRFCLPGRDKKINEEFKLNVAIFFPYQELMRGIWSFRQLGIANIPKIYTKNSERLKTKGAD